LIINKVLFLNLTEHGGSYENGACFYHPPFLSGKFTLGDIEFRKENGVWKAAPESLIRKRKDVR
jgi:hypothetical protein